MINPWVILAVVIAWTGSLVATGYWQRGEGQALERAAWVERENKELAAANDKILSLTEENNLEKAEHEKKESAITANYEKELSKNEKVRTDFIAGVLNGSIRLRIPSPRTEKAGGSIEAQSIASPSECDGEARGELPSETAIFLWGEADRADKIVEQLNACQDILILDRL